MWMLPPRRQETIGQPKTQNSVWIPAGSNWVKFKVVTIVHAGSAGHRGVAENLEIIGAHYRWDENENRWGKYFTHLIALTHFKDRFKSFSSTILRYAWYATL